MSLPQVVWKPTNKFGYPKTAAGRQGQPVRAFVRHRIVGSLASADGVFASTNTTIASTHFAIGHINGVLQIHQYVDLSDAAWGNGSIDRPTAKVVLARPTINPNLYTVSVEHEDGGAVGLGVVQPDTWATSIQLGLLLASGDVVRIRAAGIHCRNAATALEMAAVPKTVDGYIDHHQITYGKVYCFQRWLNDPGFVGGSPSRRDELLAVLNSGVMPIGDDMPQLVKFEPGSARIGGGSTIRSAPNLDPASVLFTVAAGGSGANTFIGWVKGVLVEGVDLWGVYFLVDKWAYTHKSNVESLTPIVGSVVEKIVEVPTGITQVQRDADVAAAGVAGMASGAITEKSRLRSFLGL